MTCLHLSTAGSTVPNLTYMLSAANMEEHKAHWQTFFGHPEWERMKNLPQYKDTVSKINNWFVKPADFSQIGRPLVSGVHRCVVPVGENCGKTVLGIGEEAVGVRVPLLQGLGSRQLPLVGNLFRPAGVILAAE